MRKMKLHVSSGDGLLLSCLLDFVFCKIELRKARELSFEYNDNRRRKNGMKGYFVDGGYMGYVEGSYMLFAGEEDYFEYMENM